MLTDYNARYQTTFALATYGKYKKDVAKRLAHKKPYLGIEHDHQQQIDLLIVVTQMLTGYDSKWVNTLYVDKVMKYVDIIQSFFTYQSFVWTRQTVWYHQVLYFSIHNGAEYRRCS